MKKHLTILCFLLVACGTEKNDATRTRDDFPDLIEQKGVYLEKAGTVQDKYGWIETEECDALLFTGLSMSAGLKGVEIEKGRDDSGRWNRRPQGGCYGGLLKETGSNFNKTNPNSNLLAGTISRDMLIGLMWGAWATGKQYILDDLYDYGKSHNWKMGDGDIDTVYFTPNMINTLRILIGKDDNIPEIWVDPRKDHQRHVVALNIILRGEVEKNIRDDQLSVLKKMAKAQPKNALFRYGVHRFTDGDQSAAIEILRDQNLCPAKRLPNTSERCTRWLWERREWSDNWEPCPKEKRTHSGMDCAFLISLLENSLL